jgi:hypothetical protein
MQETYQELWRALQLHSSILPTTLAQQFIRSRFRDIRRKRLWSWRIAQSQFITPAVYSTGLASTTLNSQFVIGAGTQWTSALVGQQFRFGGVAPIYTIVEVDAPNSLQIDQPYGGVTSPDFTGYQIFPAYVTPPSDFQDFISLKDTFNNYRLYLHMTQEQLDTYDAQRAWAGNPYGVADYRYSTSPTAGSVGTCTLAVGTQGDSLPFLFGTYTGRTKSIFVVTVTTGGPTGTAVYSWFKDSAQPNAGILTDNSAFLLQDGVNIQWPLGTNYTQGDVFVVSCTPGFSTQVPMYELWPYSMAQRVYPFIYDKRFPDIDDPNGMLPPFIDGDILVKGALADVCRWKGTQTAPNPMYGLDTAVSFDREFEHKVAEMEREDDETYLVDVRYQINAWQGLGMAPWPFAMGADWAQSHGVSA